MFNHQDLKARQRAIRDSFAPSLSLRTHRALSWLRRAEMEAADDDARFLFLWIAFNAAYANEILDRRALTERKLLFRFLGTLRHWEQGQRSPRGPARVLLKVVDNDPEAVIRAIDQ